MKKKSFENRKKCIEMSNEWVFRLIDGTIISDYLCLFCDISYDIMHL